MFALEGLSDPQQRPVLVVSGLCAVAAVVSAVAFPLLLSTGMAALQYGSLGFFGAALLAGGGSVATFCSACKKGVVSQVLTHSEKLDPASTSLQNPPQTAPQIPSSPPPETCSVAKQTEDLPPLPPFPTSSRESLTRGSNRPESRADSPVEPTPSSHIDSSKGRHSPPPPDLPPPIPTEVPPPITASTPIVFESRSPVAIPPSPPPLLTSGVAPAAASETAAVAEPPPVSPSASPNIVVLLNALLGFLQAKSGGQSALVGVILSAVLFLEKKEKASKELSGCVQELFGKIAPYEKTLGELLQQLNTSSAPAPVVELPTCPKLERTIPDFADSLFSKSRACPVEQVQQRREAYTALSTAYTAYRTGQEDALKSAVLALGAGWSQDTIVPQLLQAAQAVLPEWIGSSTQSVALMELNQRFVNHVHGILKAVMPVARQALNPANRQLWKAYHYYLMDMTHGVRSLWKQYHDLRQERMRKQTKAPWDDLDTQLEGLEKQEFTEKRVDAATLPADRYTRRETLQEQIVKAEEGQFSDLLKQELALRQELRAHMRLFNGEDEYRTVYGIHKASKDYLCEKWGEKAKKSLTGATLFSERGWQTVDTILEGLPTCFSPTVAERQASVATAMTLIGQIELGEGCPVFGGDSISQVLKSRLLGAVGLLEPAITPFLSEKVQNMAPGALELLRAVRSVALALIDRENQSQHEKSDYQKAVGQLQTVREKIQGIQGHNIATQGAFLSALTKALQSLVKKK